MSHHDDYVNPRENNTLIWCSVNPCFLDLDEVLQNWKKCLHEVSMRICAHITHIVQWIGTEF